MGAPVRVEAATEATEELTRALARLVPQLSRSSPPPSREEVAQIISSPATTLFVARDQEAVVGTLTLVLFRIPTGRRAWLEDVVVDEAARGRGGAEAVSRAALGPGARQGWRRVAPPARHSGGAARR